MGGCMLGGRAEARFPPFPGTARLPTRNASFGLCLSVTRFPVPWRTGGLSTARVEDDAVSWFRNRSADSESALPLTFIEPSDCLWRMALVLVADPVGLAGWAKSSFPSYTTCSLPWSQTSLMPALSSIAVRPPIYWLFARWPIFRPLLWSFPPLPSSLA